MLLFFCRNRFYYGVSDFSPRWSIFSSGSCLLCGRLFVSSLAERVSHRTTEFDHFSVRFFLLGNWFFSEWPIFLLLNGQSLVHDWVPYRTTELDNFSVELLYNLYLIVLQGYWFFYQENRFFFSAQLSIFSSLTEGVPHSERTMSRSYNLKIWTDYIFVLFYAFVHCEGCFYYSLCPKVCPSACLLFWYILLFNH